MPTGTRTPGVATGPPIGPRLVDATPARGLAALEVLAFDYAVMRGQEGAPGVPPGLIRAELRPEQAGFLMLVDRIVIQSDSGTPTTCFFYVGSVEDINLVDYSGFGDIDIADQQQPILVPGTSKLIAEWEGASAGATGVARVQYRVARLTGGGL